MMWLACVALGLCFSLTGMETHVYYDNDVYHVYLPTQNQYAALSHAQVIDVINSMPADIRFKSNDLVYLAHYMYEHNPDFFNPYHNQGSSELPTALPDTHPHLHKEIYCPPFPNAPLPQQKIDRPPFSEQQFNYSHRRLNQFDRSYAMYKTATNYRMEQTIQALRKDPMNERIIDQRFIQIALTTAHALNRPTAENVLALLDLSLSFDGLPQELNQQMENELTNFKRLMLGTLCTIKNNKIVFGSIDGNQRSRLAVDAHDFLRTFYPEFDTREIMKIMARQGCSQAEFYLKGGEGCVQGFFDLIVSRVKLSNYQKLLNNSHFVKLEEIRTLCKEGSIEKAYARTDPTNPQEREFIKDLRTTYRLGSKEDYATRSVKSIHYDIDARIEEALNAVTNCYPEDLPFYRGPVQTILNTLRWQGDFEKSLEEFRESLTRITLHFLNEFIPYNPMTDPLAFSVFLIKYASIAGFAVYAGGNVRFWCGLASSASSALSLISICRSGKSYEECAKEVATFAADYTKGVMAACVGQRAIPQIVDAIKAKPTPIGYQEFEMVTPDGHKIKVPIGKDPHGERLNPEHFEQPQNKGLPGAERVSSGKFLTVEDLIKIAKPGIYRIQCKQYELSGGFKQALKDFFALNLKNIRDISKDGKIIRIGLLEDGRMVIVRNVSSSGKEYDCLPTLEIQNGLFDSIKFRYFE